MSLDEATELILVRHGQTRWNLERRFQGQQDSPLTAEGEAQALALARSFRGERVDALYSSDLGRAVRTAQAVALSTSQPLRIDHRLRERHYGVFEGLDAQEIRERYPEVMDRLFQRIDAYSVPGGESLLERHQRVVAFLEEAAGRHEGERIVVVTHGGVLDSIFRHATGLELSVPRRFETPNGSRNVVARRKAGWYLRGWGDVHHLNGAAT